MTDAEKHLADLRSRGIELHTDGERLRWRPDFMVSEATASRILSIRPELIRLLSMPDRLARCPACRWPLDSEGRCPKCFDRLCSGCRRLTGSYFVASCIRCGNSARQERTIHTTRTEGA